MFVGRALPRQNQKPLLPSARN